MHAELDRVGAPRDLVLRLPAPTSREQTFALMRQADLVVATGSQTNVRAAYESGTPAVGVGAGNVSVIVDETADVRGRRREDRPLEDLRSRDVVLVGEQRDRGRDRLRRASSPRSRAKAACCSTRDEAAAARGGDVRRRQAGRRRSSRNPPARSPRARGSTGRPCARPKFLIVAEDGVGPDHPFSGEKLSPVLALYRADDFAAAAALAERLLRYQGAGHSVGLHTRAPERALQLGLTLPVCRVIVNQAHCFATGGSFDNALPFSLSMGCGTWGGNSISDNLNYRHFLNITRVVHPLPPERVREPTDEEFFADYRAKHGL